LDDLVVKTFFITLVTQARSQVSIFGGAQYIFRGERFLLLLYVQNKFSGRNKIWGALPPNAPRGYGPVVTYSVDDIFH